MHSELFLVTAKRFGLRQRLGHQHKWSAIKVSEKSSALLAYVLWKRGPALREELAQIFWEGVPSDQARNSLRQALFRLRTVLGPELLGVDRGTVYLRAPIASDAELEKPAAECDPEVHRLREEFALHSTIRGAAFDAWVASVRGRLEPKALDRSVALLGERVPTPRLERGARRTMMSLDLLWHHAVGGGGGAFWFSADHRWLIRRLDHVHRRNGGHVAYVSNRGGAEKFGIERALTRTLWQMAGAAGVQPERRKLLERAAASVPALSVDVQEALWDLMCAVSDEAPLLLLMEGWGQVELERIQTFLADRLKIVPGVRLIAAAIAANEHLPPLPALILPVAAR